MDKRKRAKKKKDEVISYIKIWVSGFRSKLHPPKPILIPVSLVRLQHPLLLTMSMKWDREDNPPLELALLSLRSLPPVFFPL